MQIEQEHSDGSIRLVLTGNLNERGSELLKTHLDGINPEQTREVEFDCRRVEHFGSSSIGKVLIFYKRFTGAGGKMVVSNLPAPIYEMFLELKLDTLFPVTKA